MTRKLASPRAEKKGKRSAIHAVADRFAAFRPAREVLTVVRTVPTWFVQFDHAVRVGGWPVERFGIVHGPSGAGKTYFALGLIGSFLGRGHRALFIDLERTTPITWVETALGKELAHSDRFSSVKEDTLEEMRDYVAKYLKAIIDAKEAGELRADESALIVVDSLDKIRLKGQFEALQKESAEDIGMDGAKGRAGMIRAAQIGNWLHELIGLLEKSGASMIFIARETIDPNADVWAKKFGNDYKIGGGKHVYYDSSLVVRVESAGSVIDERGGGKLYLGDRHKATIRKSKVAGKEDRQTVCHFHTHGGETDGGFDRARDVLMLAKTLAVVETASTGRLAWGKKAWRNDHDAVKALTSDVISLSGMEAEVRSKFMDVEPVQHDEDGVVLE